MVKLASTRRAVKPSGFIVWQGRSRIDGQPIVMVATRRSGNRKTGPMVQTWIIRSDVDPMDAVKTGQDKSVCGGCLHRGIVEWLAARPVKDTAKRDATLSRARGRSCYVNVGQAPKAVYAKFKRGGYPIATRADLQDLLGGKVIRFGSYGDPAAVPISVLRRLRKLAAGHTGYTHQWRDARNAGYADLLMASADSPSDRAEANAAGWRTFRVRMEGQAPEAREIVCPASEEGKRHRAENGMRQLDCGQCRACSGNGGRSGRADVVIVAHGSQPVMYSVRRNLAMADAN